MTIALLVALAAGAVVLALVAGRAHARARALERRVGKATRELERLQRAFARFAPAAVVEEVVAGGALEPAKREVTVLFADLKGFTAMSDKLDPAVLVQVLNDYFRAMSQAIAAHRGYVAKFMGDGIMAIFGAPEPNPWQARDAVEAALAMRAALAVYNETLRAAGLPELAFGVGVHRGVVVAGILGSDELVEFTVIGDTVNVAARVESATRAHDVDILVTNEVKEKLDGRVRLRALPPARVKGKPEPIPIWAVEG
ncbi:MAG: adenylate/guanylate cyclase domain-containing protein [Polyangiaceae bacterium]|nr:adenylate/guanylate cyclase domain-containing protein [Polyangiaceae bacterium]